MKKRFRIFVEGDADSSKSVFGAKLYRAYIRRKRNRINLSADFHIKLK
jgi:hypothetical protein